MSAADVLLLPLLPPLPKTRNYDDGTVANGDDDQEEEERVNTPRGAHLFFAAAIRFFGASSVLSVSLATRPIFFLYLGRVRGVRIRMAGVLTRQMRGREAFIEFDSKRA